MNPERLNQLDRYFKRNFLLGVANGILFNWSTAFIGSHTILPVFISRLTTSSVLIGLSSTLDWVGWTLPQVVVANFLAHRERKKIVYILAAVVRVTAIALLSIVIYYFGKEHTQLLLVLFFILFSTYALGGGIAGISFMDIIGKAIPPERRGSFWGYRMFFGGTLAAVSGVLVKYILNNISYPQNYALLFVIACGLITIAVTLFSLVKEPVLPVRDRKKTFLEHMKDGPRLVRSDSNFRKLYFFRIIWDCWGMATPFYVIYARKILGVTEGMAGIFLSVQMLGLIVSNIVWGAFSNRIGNKIILQSISCIAVCIPIIALTSSLLFQNGAIQFYLIIFFLLGTTVSGIAIGFSNFLLEISPSVERPIYIGFMYTFISPVFFLTTVGGLIVDYISFTFLFSVAIVFAIVSFYVATKLKEPREITSLN